MICENKSCKSCKEKFQLFVFWMIMLGMPIIVLVIGSILGNMHLAYHQVECVSIDGNNIMVNETTYKNLFSTSPLMETKVPSLPATCWTNAQYTIFYDPTVAMNIFFIVWASVYVLLILGVKLFCSKKFVDCASCGGGWDSCQKGINCSLVVIASVMLFALTIGSLIFVGIAIPSSHKSTCDRYVPVNGQWYAGVKNMGMGGEYEIIETSPMPKLPADCWPNDTGFGLTFYDPSWVIYVYYMVCGGLLISSLVCLWMMGKVCDNKKTNDNVSSNVLEETLLDPGMESENKTGVVVVVVHKNSTLN